MPATASAPPHQERGHHPLPQPHREHQAVGVVAPDRVHPAMKRQRPPGARPGQIIGATTGDQRAAKAQPTRIGGHPRRIEPATAAEEAHRATTKVAAVGERADVEGDAEPGRDLGLANTERRPERARPPSIMTSTRSAWRAARSRSWVTTTIARAAGERLTASATSPRSRGAGSKAPRSRPVEQDEPRAPAQRVWPAPPAAAHRPTGCRTAARRARRRRPRQRRPRRVDVGGAIEPGAAVVGVGPISATSSAAENGNASS